MSANVNLNNIIAASRGGGASQVVGSALSWTFSNKGYSTDELSSLDKNITTIENTRLVESYCACGNGTSAVIQLPKLISNFNSFELSFDCVPQAYAGSISTFFSQGNTGNATPWFYVARRDGFIRTSLRDDAGDIVFVDIIDAEFTEGLAYNIKVIADGTNLKVYLDDVEKDSASLTALGTITTNVASFLASIRTSTQYYLVANSCMWNFQILNGSSFPLQKSIYDISGNGNHGTPANVVWSTQDDFPYNIKYGCDLYTDDATGLVEIYVPYVDGTPVVASIASYTKQSSHPAGTFHNGCETKWILGATTYDGTGWGVETAVKNADTNEILHNNATGYGKALGYDDMVSIFDGDYLFCNVTTDNQYKDLLLYSVGDTPTFQGSISLMNYIGQGANILTDENGEYLFDENGYAIIEGA